MMTSEEMLIKHFTVSITELEEHARFLSTLGPELTIPGFDAGKMCGIFMAVGFFKSVLNMHSKKQENLPQKQ